MVHPKPGLCPPTHPSTFLLSSKNVHQHYYALCISVTYNNILGQPLKLTILGFLQFRFYVIGKNTKILIDLRRVTLLHRVCVPTGSPSKATSHVGVRMPDTRGVGVWLNLVLKYMLNF